MVEQIDGKAPLGFCPALLAARSSLPTLAHDLMRWLG
jgi:hypothetical protein